MIRRFLARLIPGRPAPSPRLFGPDAHPVRRSQLSRAAIDVTRKLQQAEFKAFIVGGAVRDLLLGITPKDFDIATDATPEQIKPLFRRAFIIGRRFRLVHVLAGPETVEVSTFRGKQVGDDTADEHGRLLSDNVFGVQAEDAVRRDFTINALYFDPATESVWDYVGGVADVKAKKLRLIGDPVTRFREDPVRMLRAVRLAAKLGIDIEKKTAAPIPRLAPLIHNLPPARVFDEMEKLLLSGHAVESLKSLRRHGLHHGVLPLLDVIPAKAKGERPMPALFAAMDAVLAQQAERLAIPRRFEATIKETWALQPRFEQRAGQRPFRLLEHPRFRAGYDFLWLRGHSGEIPVELADWWERFQRADSDERERMLRPDEAPKKHRRSRGRGRKRKAAPADVPGPPAPSEH